MVKFDTIYSKLSYSSSKVQYFTAKNSHYYTFFPKLKRNLAKIVNLRFSVYSSLGIHIRELFSHFSFNF